MTNTSKNPHAETAVEPEQSPLTQRLEQDGKAVEIDIYKGTDGWILEIVDEANNSTLWEDEFATDEEALAEAKDAIQQEGIDAFIGFNQDL